MAIDTRDSGPVQLHIVHDLGGGIEKWLGDYSRADASRRNLVLRSFAQSAAAGAGLALYGSADDSSPSRAWTFTRPIEGAAATHEEYRAALAEVLASHGIDVILASSLVGHSLDALATGLRTLVVAHDYFPYCPAINLHFGRTCQSCDAVRLDECHRENPDYQAFPGFSAPDRVAVRERYMELVRNPAVTLAVPSLSVERNLKRLDPRFAEVAFAHVPHGDDAPLVRPRSAFPPHAERLRVLVLGQLSSAKGLALFRDAADEIATFADLYFLGAGEVGEMFRHRAHIHVVARFRREELADHIASIDPHMGLLASVVEESFSYALSELMMLGVPVAATRRGSFPERIEEAKSGYLFEPDAASMVAMLRAIDADRDTLDTMRTALEGWRPRSARAMVADYHRLAPGTTGRTPAPAPVTAPGDLQSAFAAQAVTAAGLWKQLKSTSLELALVSEARERGQRMHESAWAEAQARIARLEDEVKRYNATIAAQQQALADAARHQEQLGAQLGMQLRLANERVAEMLASTSWRVSAPVRIAGRWSRKLQLLAKSVAVFAGDPQSYGDNTRRLERAWRAGGLHEVKKSLLDLGPDAHRRDAWNDYRRTFRAEVRPRVKQAVQAMARRPRISVLVPTYNTPEPMLRHMLRSLEEQLYPDWELCVADDASTETHVAKVLREYAAREPRIKLHLAPENRGVSHASNRALALATGEFVVLLDHDDALEEQALFRVAEAILADDPDFLYSDEALMSEDLKEVKRYALRPAFSLEYLRSHPYIVHLAGFRKSLLDELGGFDEHLPISQDYDLILRAAERARTIVHVPEILYQWRLHGGSSGTQRMDEVMATSRAVLERHLERSGVAGRVEAGASFNLFETRYPLAEGLKVAIVIPTKNHGELLRQCIDSIRATVKGVHYDLVVVDHESTEAATLGYLASIAPGVKIVRHEGPFNFSAINNHAVAELDGTHTHYLFCNNDIEAGNEGWLERMLEVGQQPSVGIVGAKLMYPDRLSIQHAGVIVGAYGAAEHYAKRLRYPGDPVEAGFGELLLMNHEVAAVTAACLLMRRDAFERVGGFDETIAVGFGDVDLCLNARQAGYRIVFCPHAQLVHHESFTRGTSTVDPHPEDSQRYRAKWRWLIDAGDPYYHPGLSLTSSNWSLRQPLPCRFEIRRRVVRRESPGGLEAASFSPPVP